MRVGVISRAGFAMFAASLGACGGSSTGVEAEGAATKLTEVRSVGNTTAPGVTEPPATISESTSVSATTVTPTTTASEWESFAIDPEAHAAAGERDGRKFSGFPPDTTVWLPSRLPIWLQEAAIGFGAVPDNPRPTYWVSASIPYPEGRTSVVSSSIELFYSASRISDEFPRWDDLERAIQGKARVYGTPADYTSSYEGTCGDVAILQWHEGDWQFQVSLTPGPGGCSKGIQSVQDAVEFADALVPCKVVEGGFVC